ncbi:MAG: LLM class flavin-dependent oxidoreductase [Pseudomonadota bacterium]
MKIGISVCSNYTMEDPREGARYIVERARAAREANLDTLFIGDHHVTPVHYYQNIPMLGRMLSEWDDKPAGALFMLPYWNPVLLAEQIGTLASLMSGRFILQCALGGDPRHAKALGIDTGRRVAMFNESLEIMRRLWAGEVVDHDGYWKIERARISPRPPEEVEVWVGAVAEAAIERTARTADGWLAATGLTLQQSEEHLKYYQDACARHGRPPGAMVIRRDFFIGETSQAAEAAMRPYLEKGYRGIAEEALPIGSPQQVADMFQVYFDMGYTEILVRNITADQHDALASIERLVQVREVLNG